MNITVALKMSHIRVLHIMLKFVTIMPTGQCLILKKSHYALMTGRRQPIFSRLFLRYARLFCITTMLKTMPLHCSGVCTVLKQQV